MGGRGSGRRSSFCTKPETNDAMPLDIRMIVRKGMLVSGNSLTWRWLKNGQEVASISIRLGPHDMVLSYCRKRSGEVVEQQVQVETSPCHLGGRRHWFTCPRCSKRVAVLYVPVRYFACRRCGGLGYATQREGAGDRAATKADKIRKRLGWEDGILNGGGCKPKGMHWKTYYRLTSVHDALVNQSLEAAVAMSGSPARNTEH